ncbi:helix-turn-helix domain-containing protein [Leifsonia sp. McL0607]|uniref:helix-turn-helix domain-containing protein n=1 Tax=Leifsonia sp. McL0607 TaxID=3415672 RepID=UPI003CF9E7C8
MIRVRAVWNDLARVARSYLIGMIDEPQIMTGEQVALLLQVSPRTIEEWRQQHAGPPYRRMGKHVRYLRHEVLAWFEELSRDG